MDFGLFGKAAIVTGATTGIGRAVSRLLAEEGCAVLLNHITDREDAVSYAEDLTRRTDVACVAAYGDISKAEDVDRMTLAAVQEFGRFDILVNSAAIITSCQVKDLPEEDWERVSTVNLKGAFLLARAAVNHFVDNGIAGKIINLTSQSAFRGTSSGHAHYAATKAGVVGFTKSLALETARYGICVNAVAPGIVVTPMVEEKLRERGEYYARTIPLGRAAQPEEVAYAILFLASNRADYITGTTMDVSGGIMLR